MQKNVAVAEWFAHFMNSLFKGLRFVSKFQPKTPGVELNPVPSPETFSLSHRSLPRGMELRNFNPDKTLLSQNVDKRWSHGPSGCNATVQSQYSLADFFVAL